MTAQRYQIIERIAAGGMAEVYRGESSGIEGFRKKVAIKRVLAWELEQAMETEGVSKNEMARRMRTSRSQLDRILDPNNDRIQLDTVFKAARALGRDVKLELV